MLPTIQDNEVLHIRPIHASHVKIRDIVLFKHETTFKAHRVIRKENQLFVTRGDAGQDVDAAIPEKDILGKVTAKESAATGRLVRLDDWLARLEFWVRESRRRLSHRSRFQTLLALLFWLLVASLSVTAQVTVDATTFTHARVTNPANTVTLAHTTTGSNRLWSACP